MLYDVKTPAEYFQVLEKDWRKEKLMNIRQLIMKYAPEIEEGIEYKMLGYGTAGLPLFNLNAQKNYVGLYVGTIKKIDPDGKLLAGIDCGKGCIRIKKTTPVEGSQIEEFIKQAIDHWRAGGDSSC